MRFAAFGQKFEVVSESHWFLYEFFILSRVIAINACRYIYELDSNTSHIIKRTGKMIKIDRNNAFSGLKFDTQVAKI